MRDDASLYERDFVAWAEQQASRLRVAAGEGWNLPLDWAFLAEEVEALAKRDERELASRLRRIIEHLLKMQCTVTDGPRRGWKATIVEQRREIATLLRQSPSLRTRLPALLPEADAAAVDLVRAGLDTTLRRIAAPDAPSMLDQRVAPTEAQVLGDWFPAAVPVGSGRSRP